MNLYGTLSPHSHSGRLQSENLEGRDAGDSLKHDRGSIRDEEEEDSHEGCWGSSMWAQYTIHLLIQAAMRASSPPGS